ncbi:MAG TPA: glycosyl hydrolase family 18 protein [Thermoanaerobaculia bacterium]|nr:glycosyl hydrolase family 18 protein [Thermoanaerobaculia bacterium]
MSNAQPVALYVEGVFDVQNPSPQQLEQLQGYVSDLQGSNFSVVIFAFIHVDAEGNLYFNGGAPMISGGQLQSGLSDLSSLFSTLKSSGSVGKLFFSIGGYGPSDSDFNNMGALIQQYGTGPGNPLYQNFQALAQSLSIDGIDFDLEATQYSYDHFTDTVVQLTAMLGSLGLEVTYCPYVEEDFWIGCLAQVYKNNGKQIVSWLNLQCYAGGAGNDPAYWVAAVKASDKLTGVGNPAAFVVPGLWCVNSSSGDCNSGDCPATVQETFAGYKASDPGITGGFLWQYGDILACESSGACSGSMSAQAYADAILAGLAS